MKIGPKIVTTYQYKNVRVCIIYIYTHYKLYLACLKLVMVRGISVDFGFREPFSSL